MAERFIIRRGPFYDEILEAAELRPVTLPKEIVESVRALFSEESWGMLARGEVTAFDALNPSDRSEDIFHALIEIIAKESS